MIIVESCWEIEPRIVMIASHECVVGRDREQGEKWFARRIMEKRREILKDLAKLRSVAEKPSFLGFQKSTVPVIFELQPLRAKAGGTVAKVSNRAQTTPTLSPTKLSLKA